MTRVEEMANAYKDYFNNGGMVQSNPWFSFRAGAEWADENPIKVWHKSDEVPCDWLDIIVVDINTCMKDIPYNSGEFDGYSPTAWKNFVEKHNIKIWAYSEDLLPYNIVDLFND